MKINKYDATGESIDFSERFWCYYMPIVCVALLICVIIIGFTFA